jgi:hypothetical protein
VSYNISIIILLGNGRSNNGGERSEKSSETIVMLDYEYDPFLLIQCYLVSYNDIQVVTFNNYDSRQYLNWNIQFFNWSILCV